MPCLHGNPLGVSCPGCERLTDAACAAFDRLVFVAHFNNLGYTELEWVKSGYPRATWRDAVERPAREKGRAA